MSRAGSCCCFLQSGASNLSIWSAYGECFTPGIIGIHFNAGLSRLFHLEMRSRSYMRLSFSSMDVLWTPNMKLLNDPAYGYFSSWSLALIWCIIHPARTLSASGAIQAPDSWFQAYDPQKYTVCSGFVLLLVSSAPAISTSYLLSFIHFSWVSSVHFSCASAVHPLVILL